VLVFPPDDEDGKYVKFCRTSGFRRTNIDLRVRRDHVNYDLWEKQGHHMTTEGNVVHYGFIGGSSTNWARVPHPGVRL
jgi:hypothetical protein